MGRARKALDDDEDDDLPPPPGYVEPPSPWDGPTSKKQLDKILASLGIPAIDPAARSALQRRLYRGKQLGQQARGSVTLLLRAIIESKGNGPRALQAPIVDAVHDAMKQEWLGARTAKWFAAFDDLPLTSLLDTMRGLDLFKEESLGKYLGMVLRNKLAKMINGAPVAKPVQPKKAKRLRASLRAHGRPKRSARMAA